jgi:hypothetical protein
LYSPERSPIKAEPPNADRLAPFSNSLLFPVNVKKFPVRRAKIPCSASNREFSRKLLDLLAFLSKKSLEKGKKERKNAKFPANSLLAGNFRSGKPTPLAALIHFDRKTLLYRT